MNKNTVCECCHRHFKELETIYVVRVDSDNTYYLCEKCFKAKYNNDIKFKTWWDNDTHILTLTEDELENEYGCRSIEELNDCSYCTVFEDEGDDIEVLNIVQTVNGVLQPVKSYVIINEIDKDKTIEKAENLFISLISEHENEPLSEEDRNFFISVEHYSDDCGYEIYLTWSE